jgi:uncharacterized protein YjbJ (UPF0337 family)
MNKEQLGGKLEEAKGTVKEQIGKVTNDPATQAHGVIDQVIGQVKQAYGNFKEELNKNEEVNKEDKP